MLRLFLLSLLLIPSTGFSAPAWEATLTSQNKGPHPILQPSTMEFTLSWKGMLKAGKLDIQIAPAGENKKGSLVVKSNGSSLGAASAIYPYLHSYWSELDPSTLRSQYFHSTEKDSEETIVTQNRYTAHSAKVSEISKDNDTGKVSTHSLLFPYGPARDVFSALLHIRSQRLLPGEEHVLLILPFKSPYILKVRSEAKEKHMGKDAIRLSFSMRKIDTGTNELRTYKKLKKPVTLWLSDDVDRIPLEIRASVFIGDVRAELTSFTKNP
ncbi:DUF3108 domain-containing protein [Luteolibacter sp. AS25]|uniref:DUF3108 domain-containing protein n=1 Tax=Luteolibacter sp. AS25 TaxID=3135776 RepID=UPI00398B41F9